MRNVAATSQQATRRSYSSEENDSPTAQQGPRRGQPGAREQIAFARSPGKPQPQQGQGQGQGPRGRGRAKPKPKPKGKGKGPAAGMYSLADEECMAAAGEGGDIDYLQSENETLKQELEELLRLQ